jgi:hypothetical protein
VTGGGRPLAERAGHDVADSLRESDGRPRLAASLDAGGRSLNNETK